MRSGTITFSPEPSRRFSAPPVAWPASPQWPLDGSAGTGCEYSPGRIPAALDDGDNVIRVPQAGAPTASRLPVLQQSRSIRSPRPPQLSQRRCSIDAARSANPLIAQKHLLAQIAGLGPQLPFVHAIAGAECKSSSRDLQRAPPAQAASTRTARHGGAAHPSACHGSHCAHIHFLNAATSRSESDVPLRTKSVTSGGSE